MVSRDKDSSPHESLLISICTRLPTHSLNPTHSDLFTLSLLRELRSAHSRSVGNNKLSEPTHDLETSVSQGCLTKASAVQLGVAAVKGALAQAKVEPTAIEEVYFGNVLQANVGQSPARQVVIGAGLPEETEATTINKVSLNALGLRMTCARRDDTSNRSCHRDGRHIIYDSSPLTMAAIWLPRRTGLR